jgi:MFS family permease
MDVMKNQVALLTALGVDNFGSGLFLPLALVYSTRVVGLSLTTAGTVILLGTLAGLAAPPVAGRLLDRIGPHPVVIGAQLVQALGAVTYLVARGATAVLAAAMLLAAGQQLFYSSLTSLIAEVAGDKPRDRPFALAEMVRGGSFGFGALAVGGILAWVGPVGYRVAVAADAATFVACAVMLASLVRLPRQQSGSWRGVAEAEPPRRLLSDRPFLALIVVTGMITLAVDFFLVGMPVYILVQLRAQPWLPGAILALLTALASVGGAAVVHATRRLSRIAAMQAAAALYVSWCAVSLAAVLLPRGWRAADLLAATALLALAGMMFGPRALALAEASAPPAARGRYLAAFQYAFTLAAVVAPATVALYSVAVWLPWLLVAVAAGGAILGLRVLAGHLPPSALWPVEPAGPVGTVGTVTPVAPAAGHLEGLAA